MKKKEKKIVRAICRRLFGRFICEDKCKNCNLGKDIAKEIR